MIDRDGENPPERDVALFGRLMFRVFNKVKAIFDAVNSLITEIRGKLFFPILRCLENFTTKARHAFEVY